MASGWTKSLHSKFNAVEDVYLPNPTTPSKKSGALTLSCSSLSQTLRDVVFLLPNKLPPPPKKSQNPHSNNPSQIHRQNPKSNPKSKPKSKPKTSLSIASPPASPVSLPTLADLPLGHSSRRVVEIIFGSSWSPRGSPFPGEIEMLFRVHHPPRSVARFEDHRSAVRSRSRSRSDDPRCAADGNEMMRFHPSIAASAAAGGAIYNAEVSVCAVGKMKGVRSFSGSGGAHEISGRGPGRRAMLVCRVIAGRVADGSNSNSEAESVRLGKGELLVFDPRAVLPCFLIIYKISP